jgi:hypothetical protein
MATLKRTTSKLETEAGGWRVSDHHGVHSEILSQNNKTPNNQKEHQVP